MEVHFIVIQQNGNNKKFKLNDNEYVIIGRSSEKSQVIIDDTLCSGAHCKVSNKNGKIHVDDLKSKNGIYLNGVKIERQTMFIDDQLRMGKTTLIINANRMESSAIKKYKFRGKGTRTVNFMDLELENSDARDLQNINLNDNASMRKIIREKIEMGEQKKKGKMYTRTQSVLMTRLKFNTLTYLAYVFDISLAFTIFLLSTYLVIINNDVLNELMQKNNYFSLLFAKDMVFYSIFCLVLALFFHNYNRKRLRGSFGKMLFKI